MITYIVFPLIQVVAVGSATAINDEKVTTSCLSTITKISLSETCDDLYQQYLLESIKVCNFFNCELHARTVYWYGADLCD